MWGTTTLIGACRVLSDEQLRAPGRASYGSILETFNHLVLSDASYFGVLGGKRPSWSMAEQPDLVGIDQLDVWTGEMTGRWESFLGGAPFDPLRTHTFEDGYRTHLGVLFAQVIHHGTLHREQICAMLTALDIEPPDLQPWSWADDRGIGSFDPP